MTLLVVKAPELVRKLRSTCLETKRKFRLRKIQRRVRIFRPVSGLLHTRRFLGTIVYFDQWLFDQWQILERMLTESLHCAIFQGEWNNHSGIFFLRALS